jgi:hypothetical protein
MSDESVATPVLHKLELQHLLTLVSPVLLENVLTFEQ